MIIIFVTKIGLQHKNLYTTQFPNATNWHNYNPLRELKYNIIGGHGWLNNTKIQYNKWENSKIISHL